MGWAAYRQGRFDEAIRLFESSSARFPRSDYRPLWIYWSARAHDQLGNAETANARYAIVVADYQNSYYGRLASQVLAARNVQPRTVVLPAPAAPAADEPGRTALPPTADIIRALIASELYDDALNELQYAQRAWGDSPAIEATMGLIYSRSGDLRRGINAIKRAYPQYIAAGGEAAAGRDAEGPLPGGLLGRHQAALERARAGSLRGRGADGAGVDVRRRDQVARQCGGADADRPLDRIAATRSASACGASGRRC